MPHRNVLILFLHPTFLGDELSAGGKDGFGKGIASFAEHVVGKSQITLLRVSNYSLTNPCALFIVKVDHFCLSVNFQETFQLP